jgi:WD40 repeat protein
VLILRGHTDTVRCVAYAPDGRLLASGAEDGTVRLWSLPAGTPIHTVGELGGVEALAFAPDGRYLAAGLSDGGLHRRDTKQWELAGGYIAHPGGTRCLAYAAEGEVMATAGWDRAVLLWEGEAGHRTPLQDAFPDGATSLAFTPDDQTLGGGSESAVVLYDLADLRVRATLPVGDSVLCLACSPDGRFVAAGDRGGKVTLWHASTTAGHAVLRGHEWAVFAVAFTPDGQRLVSGGADATVRLWDVASGRALRSYQWHSRWVTCAAVAPDGMTAAAGSEDHTVVVWDMEDY